MKPIMKKIDVILVSIGSDSSIKRKHVYSNPTDRSSTNQHYVEEVKNN